MSNLPGLLPRLFFCLLVPVLLAAEEKPLRLDASRRMTSYTIATWRDTSGLPADSVPALAQTPDGYLWIGTEHGLVRFDGVRFTTFNTTNTPQLRTNEIAALLVSRSGTLWIGTRGGGALTYDGRAFTRVPVKYRFAAGFAESPDGSIWIGTPLALIRFRGGRYTVFDKTNGYEGGFLATMAADATGVYVGFPDGIVRMGDDGRVTKWDERHGFAGEARFLLASRRGLLAGDHEGNIFRLTASGFEPFLRTGQPCAITWMMEGAQGSLWIATVGGGLLRSSGGELARLTERDGLTSDTLNVVLEDEEGSLWVGTTGGGLIQLKEPRLTVVEPEQRLTADWVLSLTPARDGSVWFGTSGGGLNRLQGEKLTRFGAASGLRSDVITAVAEDAHGTIWVGSNAGLQRIVNGRATNVTRADGIEGTRIISLAPSARGGVWASVDGHLHYITPGGQARPLTEKEGATSGFVVSIREANDGSLWLGKPLCVEHVKDGRVTVYGREQGLIGNTVSSLMLDEIDGSVWVASMGSGLFRIRNGRMTHYGEADGLLTNSIYGVVEDGSGNLWIPTGRGLFSIKRAAIDAFDRRQTGRIAISVFRKADGLKSSDFSGGFDRPGFRAADGTLWFPTTRGLVAVDPKRIRANYARPHVVIEEVVANGERHTTPVPSIVPPSEHREIEFSYSAPSFYAPGSLTFRYKLEGYDDVWREAGSRRIAYYTNIPPGRYRFVVRAMSAEGQVGEAATTVTLEPHFYETWRFRIAAALVLLLIALVFHRHQVEELQRHQTEIEKSEVHFRSLIENASDMIIEVGLDARVRYASPSVQRILGLRPFAVDGRELGSLLADFAAAEAFLAEVRSSGHHSAQLSFRDSSGSVREVEVFGAASKASRHIVLNCRDITERRRLEAQLAQANRLSSLGRLAATVSHEFNNVLMGIQPFVDVIRRKSELVVVQNAAAQISSAVARGKRITEQMLRYTRSVEPTLAPVRLRSWLTEMAGELAALTGQPVRLSAATARSVAVSADTGQLTQVLTNLAINARDAGATELLIDARPADGDGRFAFGIVSSPERFAHITVADNGSGIPPAVLPHVFEPLFTTKSTRGTGLGLAVVQQVVSRHGGEVFVESDVDRGTTFHIFLPLCASLPEEEPIVIEELIRKPPSCRLLLVEDDPMVSDGLMMLLQDEGFSAALAPTGLDALGLIPRFAPDVVVLDVGLPDMDGVDVYREISRRWPGLPVIFSTGHGWAENLRDLAPPHPPFLVKPYPIEALSETVATILENKRIVA
jgi:PAS domain S-box-containing protein